MYLSHFNLNEKPFKISTDPKFLWLGEKHKEALASLRYGVLYGDGYMVVTGDVGTGKTTIASALMNELGDEVIAAKIPYPDVEALDFFRLILTAYGMSGDFRSKGGFLTCFDAFLRSSHAKGKRVVLIIDEAQKLSEEHLGELLHLSNIEENGARLFNLVFVGQNELNDILLEESHRALRQRVAINYSLGPLTEDETRRYISHRLHVAACDRDIFSLEAVQEAFRFSGGIPRLINVVCDLALLMTYLEGGDIVRPETVGECIERLRLPSERTHLDSKEMDSAPEREDGPEESPLDNTEGDLAGESVKDYGRNPARFKVGYAVAFSLLVVVLALLVFLFSRSSPRREDAARQEAKGEMGQERHGAETGVQAVGEKVVPGAASLGAEGAGASGGEGQGSGSRSRGKSSGAVDRVKEKARTGVGGLRTETQGGVGLRTSPEPNPEGPTSAVAEEGRFPGKEKTPGTGDRSAAEERGQEVPQAPGVTPGGSDREDPARDGEGIESGRVIDWLLEKRSEKN
jgi:type II secretory pathway predicted ATPase ExeA